MTGVDQLRRYYNADRERFEKLQEQLNRIEKQLAMLKMIIDEAARAISRMGEQR